MTNVADGGSLTRKRICLNCRERFTVDRCPSCPPEKPSRWEYVDARLREDVPEREPVQTPLPGSSQDYEPRAVHFPVAWSSARKVLPPGDRQLVCPNCGTRDSCPRDWKLPECSGGCGETMVEDVGGPGATAPPEDTEWDLPANEMRNTREAMSGQGESTNDPEWIRTNEELKADARKRLGEPAMSGEPEAHEHKWTPEDNSERYWKCECGKRLLSPFAPSIPQPEARCGACGGTLFECANPDCAPSVELPPDSDLPVKVAGRQTLTCAKGHVWKAYLGTDCPECSVDAPAQTEEKPHG